MLYTDDRFRPLAIFYTVFVETYFPGTFTIKEKDQITAKNITFVWFESLLGGLFLVGRCHICHMTLPISMYLPAIQLQPFFSSTRLCLKGEDKKRAGRATVTCLKVKETAGWEVVFCNAKERAGWKTAREWGEQKGTDIIWQESTRWRTSRGDTVWGERVEWGQSVVPQWHFQQNKHKKQPTKSNGSSKVNPESKMFSSHREMRTDFILSWKHGCKA